MKKILKIGDKVYSQSLKHPVPLNLEGFPQREKFLLDNTEGVLGRFFSHEVIRDAEDIAKERKRLSAILADNGVDYIMVDNPLSALIIERDVNIPILFDCIDWYDEVYLKEFGLDKRYYLLRYGLLDLLERASKVVAQSPVILDAMKLWGLKAKDTLVLPNGYDSKIFFPYDDKKREELKLSIASRHDVDIQGKTIIVYTGRLSAWYDSIKIIAQAIEDDQILFIVGEGPLLDEIPTRKNVIKVGAVEYLKVPEYTNIADVVVFPVESDCSPIVVSEYLALGKPIVMPRGRMEWLLRDGETGAMVDNNIYAWRMGLRSAFENRNAIKAKNIELASSLSWQKLGEKFASFILN